MSKYYFLEDCAIGIFYYPAGSTATTADEVPTATVPNTLPTGWVPNAAVDPLNTAAVNAFYNAGVQLPRPASQQFGSVTGPVTYWTAAAVAGSQAMKWTLTGLGVSKTPIFQ